VESLRKFLQILNICASNQSMPLKSYSQHIRDAKGCSSLWRILILKPAYHESASENLTKFRVIPCRCNSKACPSCSRIYFSKIKNSFKYASVSDNWRFFTLTTVHKSGSEMEELQQLEIHFRELRKKLKRKFPNFKYFAVKELSPSGMWHYHGLWNIFIDLKELSKMWEGISGAYRCDLQKVRNPRGAINYIFKYCFKSVDKHQEKELLFESGKRKFTTSRGLLNKCEFENPYTCELNDANKVQEIKEKLLDIVVHSDCASTDFSSFKYPYFEDLIQNIFHEFFCKSPPTLFATEF
jgi:hypothetical protein